MFRAVLVFLLMNLVSASFAAEPSEQFSSCMDDSGGVTASMLDCIGQENQRVDGELNALWQTELPKQDADFKDMLRASQRAWIAYRDATCDVEGAQYEGGSLAGVAYSDCHRQLTTDRLDWLSRILEEG